MARVERRLGVRVEAVLRLCGRHLFQGAAFIPQDASAPVVCGVGYCRFCKACLGSSATSDSCRRSILSSAYQSLQTGEPYYHRCWLGLSSVVVPAAPGGRMVGAFELGGFHFAEERAENDRFVADNIRNLGALAKQALASLRHAIPSTFAREIHGAADFLFDSLFSTGINSVDAFRENREKYLQQRRIGELMQSYGGRMTPAGDVFDLFSALTLALKLGDRGQIMLLLDDFFSRILLITGAAPEPMKAHVHVLLSVLTREAVTSERLPLEAAVARHFHADRQLANLTEPEDVCYWAFRQVDSYVEALKRDDPMYEDVVTRVLNWIDSHFWEKASLVTAAQECSASVSCITQKLRKKTGRTFHDHLTEMRLKEARHMLVQTNVPLAQIALRCGFCDQSHFSRVFKAEFHEPPGRFRRQAQSA